MSLQIFRFTLSEGQTIFKSQFPALRLDVERQGAVNQYFGYSVAVTTAALPKRRHEITWVIEWKSGVLLQTYPPLVEQFLKLANDATGLILSINDAQRDGYLAALQSPICELVSKMIRYNNYMLPLEQTPMRLLPETPMDNELFRVSVHKTFTDCYGWPGFVSGDWGYIKDTNDVLGAPLEANNSSEIPEDQRRLAFYLLGWESAEIHEDFSKSPLFFEEIVKLAPWIDKSSGAWYVRFMQHGV
ncbi:hypothetical protein VHEMI05467 [[Torrubiella] hemipterigena]|uniref:ABM domain-containing protein n=1 Tax=[Torrubiella] hemipterigena TaxID=1531966 RepID=A0A0A1TGR3_9HYPO|nr:hypothetical protein VHEMI05467 [[Torrubiella] hemipterigena]